MNTVEVEQLSKRYLLGEDRPGGSLVEWASQSIRRLARFEPRPRRDAIWALRNVSLSVEEGESLGIIGRNGAGKTTLLKVLSRICEPTSGVARTRGRVTSLLEVGTGFHPELTGRENVYLNGAILGMRKREIDQRFDEIVSFAGVDRFTDTPVKRYSSGMYLRLAFAVAAHLEPDIMVVDEVLAVGDAEFQAKCLGRMESAEREGRTVLFVSHNLDAISRLCTRVVWLEQGMVKSIGPAQEIVDAYLTGESTPTSEDQIREDSHGNVALQGVSILNASGRTAQVLRRDRALTIEVRFSVRAMVPGLDLAVFIQNSRGVEVLNEAWSDTSDDRQNEPGEYVARLEIPSVLNVGDYVAGVWIGTGYETLLQDVTARRFRVQGDPKDRPKRSVVLGLPWRVMRVGVPTADQSR